MAEAFLNKYGADKFEAESAGLEPGVLNPLVIKVMQEESIDISENETKSVFGFLKEDKTYDYVITVCDKTSGERCPYFPGKTNRMHWTFNDPSSLSGNEEEKLVKIRIIRNDIKEKIKEFIKDN